MHRLCVCLTAKSPCKSLRAQTLIFGLVSAAGVAFTLANCEIMNPKANVDSG